MARHYQRKLKKLDHEKLKEAIQAVRCGWKIQTAAKHFSVPRTSLRRYFRQVQEAPNHSLVIKKAGRKTIFTKAQEEALEDYMKKCSRYYYGLHPRDVRILAYHWAKKLNIPVEKWDSEKIAGVEWFTSFMKRHPTLSIRLPEATSIQRAMAFNKTNVNNFFLKLKMLYDEFKFDPSSVYNMDETGLSTVQNPRKIISEKGVKQVGRITSAERGSLVTMALAVNATGNVIPPMFVFPRVHFQEKFLTGKPAGSIGVANKSGWMTSEIFPVFLKHFQEHSGASKSNPKLLILDNHESHLSVEGIEFCVKNGISLLTLPPHTSHRMQPLDVSVYGPFKQGINYHCDLWMTANPGVTMKIEHMANIAALAMNSHLKRNSVISGFSSTGIYPFNPFVFKDDDFMPASVSDKPLCENNVDQTNEHTVDAEGMELKSREDPQPSPAREETSSITTEPLQSMENDRDFLESSLEELRPLPKAASKTNIKRGRKRRVTAILTDPEVLQAIKTEKDKSQQAKSKIIAKKFKSEQEENVPPTNGITEEQCVAKKGRGRQRQDQKKTTLTEKKYKRATKK